MTVGVNCSVLSLPICKTFSPDSLERPLFCLTVSLCVHTAPIQRAVGKICCRPFPLSLSLSLCLSLRLKNEWHTDVRPTDNIVLRKTHTHVGNGIIHQGRERGEKEEMVKGKGRKKVYLHSYGIFMWTRLVFVCERYYKYLFVSHVNLSSGHPISRI